MIRLRDLLKCGGDLLIPKEPVAPFRYVERLVNRAAALRHRDGDVLEIGPGSETMLCFIRPEIFRSVTVIDYDGTALQKAKERLSGISVHCICCDVTQHDCLTEHEAFDLIIANAVVEHLEDDEGFITRVHACLKSGGTALCTTVLDQKRYNLWDHAVGHYRRYAPEQLRRLLRKFPHV